MSALHVFGTNDTVKQGTMRRWNRNQGKTHSTIYRGPSDKVIALFNSMVAFGGGIADYDEVTCDEANGTGTLTATSNGAFNVDSTNGTDADPVYEVVTNQVARKIEAAPYFVETSPVLTAADISKAYAVYNRTATLADGTVTPAASTLTGKTATLYAMLEAGIHEYYSSAYVLRCTRIVSERSLLRASFDDVNTVTAPPSGTTVNQLIGSLPAGEWLKQGPQVRTYGNGQWEIVQEWWWATKWSSALYGGSLSIT